MSFSSLTFTWSVQYFVCSEYLRLHSPRGCCAVPFVPFVAATRTMTGSNSSGGGGGGVGRIWLRNHLPPCKTRRRKGKGAERRGTSHLPSKDFLPRWKLDIQGTEDIGYDTVMSQMRPYGLNFDSNCPLSLSLFFWRLQSTGYNTIFTSDQPQQCSYIQYTRYKIHDPLMKYDRLIFMLEERNVNLAGTEKDKFSKHSHNYGE